MTLTHEPATGSARQPANNLELRWVIAPLTHVEVRDPTGTDDGTWTMSGYAAVFNQTAVLLDGKFIRLEEEIDPAAFDRVLREQPMGQPDGVVHFNVGHDMNRAVAATDVANGQPGWLELRADSHGLHYFAKVSRDDPDGVALASKMRTGVVRQSSFAFTIASVETTDEENADGPDVIRRRILEIKHLYDVAALPQGAYPWTVSQLRSYAAAIGQLDGFEPSGGQAHQPAEAGGATGTSPDEGRAGGDPDPSAWREQMRARIAIAKHDHQEEQ